MPPKGKKNGKTESKKNKKEKESQETNASLAAEVQDIDHNSILKREYKKEIHALVTLLYIDIILSESSQYLFSNYYYDKET